jgi:hypothetical protein
MMIWLGIAGREVLLRFFRFLIEHWITFGNPYISTIAKRAHSWGYEVRFELIDLLDGAR